MQTNHKKIKDIVYKKYTKQTYIQYPDISYQEASMLVALRSQCVKQVKGNFHTFYQHDKMCPLCLRSEDTQQHCLECPKLARAKQQLKKHVEYNHIYSKEVSEQKEVASMFLTLLETRDRLLQDGLPGAFNTGPNIVHCV